MRKTMATATPKPARRRGNVTLRMRDEVRTALQKEADARGHSLSEEIEGRLERSLLDQRLAIDAFDLVYGRQLNDVLLALGKVIKATVEYQPFYLDRAPVGWLDYPWKFDQVVLAVNYFLERLRPVGPVQAPQRLGIHLAPVAPLNRIQEGGRERFRQIHERAAEIETEQALHIGTLIAEREIQRITTAQTTDTGPHMRDEQVIGRLKQQPNRR